MNMYHTLVVSICFLSLLFIKPHVCFKFNSVSKNAVGFSLKLIHRDSPESPLYPGRELTFQEKLSRYSKATDARAAYLSTRAGRGGNLSRNDEQQSIGRGSVRLDSLYYYLVNVIIGSPPVDVLLLFDTASSLVWTQCKPCEHCFQQNGDMYDSAKSRYFKLLPCDQCANSHIYECRDDKCYYNERYGGGSYTIGFGMRERMLFSGVNDAKIPHNIVMGCSNNSEGFRFEQDSGISGVLGMSLSPHSFPNQFGTDGANVFSYCLPTMEHKLSYLTFGSDVVTDGKSPMQTVPVVIYKNKAVHYYGLELVDISINGRNLNFPPGTFAEKEYATGGCFIDTGAPLTMIDQPVFDTFIEEYEKFYLPTELTRDYDSCTDPRTYCYASKGLTNIDQHPNVGFHFKNGAIYIMQPKNLINFSPSYFTLMLRPGDRTIIGAWQQRGMQIIHDLRPEANALSFSLADCDNQH